MMSRRLPQSNLQPPPSQPLRSTLLRPLRWTLMALPLSVIMATISSGVAAAPVDGQYPPAQQIQGKWLSLFSGALTDHWTSLSLSVDSPLLKTTPDEERPGQFVLKIERGPTGVIRSLNAFENFILEVEWRHLAEAPSANGGPQGSGNSGLLVCHGPYPSMGGPFPTEGHEVQVCHLGNGSWYSSHGDVFTLPGTQSQAIPDPRFGESHSCGHRSMPIEFRARKTGEWNQVRITCVDGVLQQEMNGALVTSLYRISPRKGYLSIESEGSPVEFRRMRLQELRPDPDLAAKHVAPIFVDQRRCERLTEKKAHPLPATGDFSLLVDLAEASPLATTIEGLGLPMTAQKGRLLIHRQGGAISATLNGKPLDGLTAASQAPSVRLDVAGKFGHVLLFQPVLPKSP